MFMREVRSAQQLFDERFGKRDRSLILVNNVRVSLANAALRGLTCPSAECALTRGIGRAARQRAALA